MKEEPLERLLSQVRQGDPAAAEQLVTAFGPGLRGPFTRPCPTAPDRVSIPSMWSSRSGSAYCPVSAPAPGTSPTALACGRSSPRWPCDGWSAACATTSRLPDPNRPVASIWTPCPRPPSRGPARSPRPRNCGNGCSSVSPRAPRRPVAARLGLGPGEIARRTGLHEGQRAPRPAQLARRLALEQGPAPSCSPLPPG